MTTPAVIEKQCRDCGEAFGIDAGEKAFFEEKSLSLPTRCRPCRAVKRHQERGEAFTDTICADCDGRAVVPFDVQPGRLVYCESCLAMRRRGTRGGL